MSYLKEVFDKTVAERLYIRYDYTTVELSNNCYILMFEKTIEFVEGVLPLDKYLYELHKWSTLNDMEIAAFIEELECIRDEEVGLG